MIDSWETLLTAGVVLIGIVLSLLLWVLKKEAISTRVLGLYTLVLAVGMAEPLLHEAGLSSRVIAYYGAISFFYGPLLFLYVKYSLTMNTKFSGHDFFHFAPAIIYLVLVFISPEKSKVNQEEDTLVALILYELLFYQIFYYTIKAFTLWTRAYSMAGDKPVILMKFYFGKYLLIFSAILFASSFIFVHVFVMAKMSPFPAIFYTYIQIAFTLLILMIAFLNTELIYPKRLST